MFNRFGKHRIINLLTGSAVAVSLASAALHSPVCAATLQPGTYKLEWKLPATDGDVSFAGRSGAPLHSFTQDAPKIEALRSSQCFVGSTDAFTIILDESQGTGSGYDTAYVIRGNDSTAINIENATKVPLVKQEDALRADSNANPIIDLLIGEEGAKVTRKAAVGLEVFLDNSKSKPELAMLTLRGGLYGKIKTNEGELIVQAADVNSNGIYGEMMAIDPATDYPLPGDAILIGTSSKDLENYSNVLNLGEVVSYDGKLYKMKLNKTGDTLEVQPYADDLAVLGVDTRDGNNRPAKCSSALFYSEAGMFYSNDGNDVSVPPGSYRCLSALIEPKSDGSKDDAFGVLVQTKSAVQVEKDQRTSIKLGGPISLSIEPESDKITANAGSQKAVTLSLSISGNDFAGMQGSYKAWANIRNSRGKRVYSQQLIPNSKGTCEYIITIPSSLKPGIYSLGIGFDPSPYQKPITAQKMLKVVK